MRNEVKNVSGSLAMEKSFSFALRIVRLYQHLADKKKEFVLSKQIRRPGPVSVRIWKKAGELNQLRIFRQRFPLRIKKRVKPHTGCVFFMHRNISPNDSSTASTPIAKN